MTTRLKWVAALFQCIIILLVIKQAMPTYPDSHKIDAFVVYRQPDGITCGPTSCSMLLNYYGKKVSVEEAKEKALTKWFEHDGNDVGMTLPDYVAFTMKSFGVPSKLEASNIHRLKYYVSENRPPIVLLRSGKKTWHYVVVIGYMKDKIIIADPGWGKQVTMPIDNFEGAWDFSTDMRGEEMLNDFDPFLYMVTTLGDVSGNTMIVPKNPQGDVDA